MMHYQAEIIAPLTSQALYLHFRRRSSIDKDTLLNALKSLQSLNETDETSLAMVVGLGADLLDYLDVRIPGMRSFPDFPNATLPIHISDTDLFVWLKSDDRGTLFHSSQTLQSLLGSAFETTRQVTAFCYQAGRDLTGYEDGTENPVDDAAIACAILNSEQQDLHGSSFLAIQQWQHNFDAFHAMSRPQQDHMIGRRLSDNEELDDAPESAHVKRTAQESFIPEAFLLRRSMPWVEQNQAGLYFAAFGNSFDAFEAQFKRMLGLEDGIVDALFQISTPIHSAYFWCPPMRQGRLNLSALGLSSS